MTSKQFKYLIFFLGLAVFINVYYEINLFIFNPQSNNPEEIPLINKLMGVASYENDEFVTVMTSNFTQATPYITLITLLGKLFHTETNLLFIYFSLHLLTLVLFYISIRHILKQITTCNELITNISIISFMLFLEIIYVVPNQRNLFYDFLDPEFLTYPFLFLTISLYLEKKHFLSLISLLVGTILHPLYTIPLLFGLLICLLFDFINKSQSFKTTLRNMLLYTGVVIPYSGFLWFCSRQKTPSELDSSLILEIVRAPHHYKIPTVISYDHSTLVFFIYVFITAAISLILFKTSIKNKTLTEATKIEAYTKLCIINLSLVSLLIFTSLFSQFIRLQILVRLTPYRIGVVIVVLSWLLLIASLINLLKLTEHVLNVTDVISLCICVLVFLGINLTRTETPKTFSKSSSSEEFINWIKKDTKNSDLFLNYTDIDIRTTALRSDYFRFQTPPLVGDAEIAWYKEFYIFYDIPDETKLTDYASVKNYASSQHTISLNRVLRRINKPIKYVLISKSQKSFSRIEDWVNLKNKNYKYDISGLKKAFENKDYSAYTTN